MQSDSNLNQSKFDDQETSPGYVQGHVQEHIDLIAKHEQDFLNQRSTSERLGDRTASFIGSLTYVTLHAVVFAAWSAINVWQIGQIPHFDPFPFPFLDSIFAFEAILVASFILMRQSRMSRRAEERDQLMLQVLLLSEREITAVLSMQRQIASRMGLHKLANDQEISQLSEQTSIDDVANIIKESLPSE